ncbi:MAG: hypothetical protein ABT19_08125 [Rhodanobacter sp. SCN 68-63]|nr:MAG: hypothetical protein ABT19_08125 [Rhodanobacter sp. SCN 68-63]
MVLQSAHKHAGDALALIGAAGFLFHDGREDQRVVRGGQRQVGIAAGPQRIERLVHGRVGALEHVHVAVALHVGIGFRQEAPFRRLARRADLAHQGGVVQPGGEVLQFVRLVERAAQLGESPAVDDGEVVLQHAAAGHGLEQRARRDAFR